MQRTIQAIPVTGSEMPLETIIEFYRTQAARDLKTIESQSRTIRMLTLQIERLRKSQNVKNTGKHKIM